MIYEAVNRPVLDAVPATVRRLLDLGCGSGALGRNLKQSINCEIVGVTYSEAEAVLARKALDQVLVRDLNTFEPKEAGEFDCVICSHVLEHLYAPEELLRRLRKSMSVNGTLIVALPNVLHWRQRVKFVRGHFRYTDGGIMDRTHFRFFDWITAQAILEDNGFEVVAAHADGTFPLSRFLFRVGRWLDSAAVRMLPGSFGVQFVFVCRGVGREAAKATS
jgi:2-polyprenyl-3-methyl-5-hydroxy-6-metoxy-1,4-benzoquinol methylase